MMKCNKPCLRSGEIEALERERQMPASEASRPATPERRAQVPDSFNIFTPQNMPTRQASGSPEGTPFLSPEDTWGQYPWWPGQEESEQTTVFHSITIPNRAGIIIDPGAYTNLIGENTAREFSKLAKEHGFQPRQWRMKPMYVQGGEGQQKCECTASISIACKLSIDGKLCCLNYFEAPVVGGSGARLPALLGLRSLSALSATLSMREGHEALFIPVSGSTANNEAQRKSWPLIIGTRLGLTRAAVCNRSPWFSTLILEVMRRWPKMSQQITIRAEHTAGWPAAKQAMCPSVWRSSMFSKPLAGSRVESRALFTAADRCRSHLPDFARHQARLISFAVDWFTASWQTHIKRTNAFRCVPT